MKIINYKIRNQRGFVPSLSKGYTIIETMISISLFLILIMTGMTSLLNANLVHKKSQGMRSEIDNLSFIMEDMSRNLRMGSMYHCISEAESFSGFQISKSSQNNSENCIGIAFEPNKGSTIDPNNQLVYFIDNDGVLWKSTQGPYNTFPINFFKLTPDEVKIDYTKAFLVLGAEAPPDKQQPLVIIKLVGNVVVSGVSSPFSLETIVSQRLLDI